MFEEITMANTASSKKQKGTRFEKYIAARLEDVLGGYGVEATRMIMSGAVDRFKGDIFTNLPVSFELKNQERFDLRSAWQQAGEACSGSGKMPVVVFSRNYEKDPLAVLKFEDLLFFFEIAVQNGWVSNLRRTKKVIEKSNKLRGEQ